METTSALKNPLDLDKIVTGLADDIQKMMVLLYDLQKSLDPASSPPFANVRKELRSQWEGLRAYLQRCYGFGEDILVLKDSLGESAADLIEFLQDMVASADELRDISKHLPTKDMSEAFSKAKSEKPANVSNPSSVKGIRNVNLKVFVIAIGSPSERKYLGEIDNALERVGSNFERMSKFWDDTYGGCVSLMEQLKTTGASIPPADAEQIVSNWKRYQEATTNAIASITKTDNAILVEAVGTETTGAGNGTTQRVRSLLYLFVGFVRKWFG